MKALHILKIILKDTIMSSEKAYVNEAIKELEDLQNRSCDNCKHNKEQDDSLIFCDQEISKDGTKMKWHGFTKDFCCKF